MCVIIVSQNPHKHPISAAEVRRANATNPHGWGMAALYKNGKIAVARGWTDEKAVADLKRLQENAVAVVFHARIATSGRVDESGLHPFAMPAPDGARRFLFHNGILRGIPMPNPTKSDTWHLATTLRRYASNAQLWEYLETFGKENASKFVVVHSKGVEILNRTAGVEQNGKWYSNRSAFPLKALPAQSQSPYLYKSFEEWKAAHPSDGPRVLSLEQEAELDAQSDAEFFDALERDLNSAKKVRKLVAVDPADPVLDNLTGELYADTQLDSKVLRIVRK